MAAASFKVIGIGAATRRRILHRAGVQARMSMSRRRCACGRRGGPVATALAVLSAHGHDCTLVDATGEAARAVILVRERDGARQIVFSPSPAPEPAFEPELLAGARLLHVNGRHENAARAAVRLAQAQSVEISFDGGAGRFQGVDSRFVRGEPSAHRFA
jgi:sulfofructose kinase